MTSAMALSNFEQMEALRVEFQNQYSGITGGAAEHEAWNNFRLIREILRLTDAPKPDKFSNYLRTRSTEELRNRLKQIKNEITKTRTTKTRFGRRE